MIRRLTDVDTDAFLKIRMDSLRAYPRSFGADSSIEPDAVQTRRDLQQKNEEDFILGYFEGGTLIGIIGFLREKNVKKKHKGWIWGMFVYPEKGGQGIGKKLLEVCIARASRLEGLIKINLSVTEAAGRALGLYQKMGFREYGRESMSMYWDGAYLDEIFMEKILVTPTP